MTHLRKTQVVAGIGVAGRRFVEAAAERRFTERDDIVVVGEEPRPAYSTERGPLRPAVSGGPVDLGSSTTVGAS